MRQDTATSKFDEEKASTIKTCSSNQSRTENMKHVKSTVKVIFLHQIDVMQRKQVILDFWKRKNPTQIQSSIRPYRATAHYHIQKWFNQKIFLHLMSYFTRTSVYASIVLSISVLSKMMNYLTYSAKFVA